METAASPTTACNERSLLPAYFYPGPAWDAALASATGGSTIIVNPASGPGAAFDPNYARVVAAAQAKGAVLYGYVDTKYATVPLATLQRQVQDYRSWYGIGNIFFDDASSQSAAVGYYASASQMVKSAAPGASVMLNPGDYPSSQYATLGDILVIFEGTFQQLQASTPPAWLAQYPATQFAALVNDVPATAVGTALALAGADHAAYVYATPQTVSSTLYEQVPSYWGAELASLATGCRSSGGIAGAGYWEVASDGGIFAFGAARFDGSMGATHLNAPIVGMG